MNTVELWVPIVGRGTEEDPYRPDVDVPYSVPGSLPADLDPRSPTHGRPATRHARVRVPEADRPRVVRAVDPDEVSPADRLLVELCRGRRQVGVMDLTEEAHVTAVFQRESHRAADADGRRLLAGLLLQMVHRGLRDAKANEIATDLGLFVSSEMARPEGRG